MFYIGNIMEGNKNVTKNSNSGLNEINDNSEKTVSLSIDNYNSFTGITKEFIDSIIWYHSFAKDDLIDHAVVRLLYPKYEGVLRKFNKINKQFNGKKDYSTSIMDNLRILKLRLSDEEQKLIDQITEDYNRNKEFYESHALICSVFIAVLKTDTDAKKEFSQYGIGYEVVRKILGVQSEYYGGLGAYQDRWFELRPKLCSSDTSVEDVNPDMIFNNVINTPQGHETFMSLLRIISKIMRINNLVASIDLSTTVSYANKKS